MHAISLRAVIALSLAALPSAVFGFSDGPPTDRVGIDGGASCTACHRVFGSETQQQPNADPRGSLRIETKPYRPGVKQIIRVILQHPDAQRWGFEITPRLAASTGNRAGSLSLDDTSPVKLRLVESSGNHFVTHLRAATFLGQRGGASWDIEWTPPSTNVGDVVFFLAGNAANGNGNNQGDRIYTISVKISPEAPCAITGTPRIRSVLNGASMLGSGLGLPTGQSGFASNSEVALFGQGFQSEGVTSPLSAGYLVGRRLPDELACVAVEIAGQRARLSYASSGQINAQMPTTASLGVVPVYAIVNPGTAAERRSEASFLRIDAGAPSFFQFAGTSSIAARFQDGTAVGVAKPAKIGDLISVFANGLGPTDPAWLSGQMPTAAAKVTSPIVIEWNGLAMDAADVQYVGLSPGSASSLYQLNLYVPKSAVTGSNRLRIRMGSLFSQDGVSIQVQ
jgi:uncharacterized protein (TIGR03437 family)